MLSGRYRAEQNKEELYWTTDRYGAPIQIISLNGITVPEHLHMQTCGIITNNSDQPGSRNQKKAEQGGHQSFGRSTQVESTINQEVQKMSCRLWGVCHLNLITLNLNKNSFSWGLWVLTWHRQCQGGSKRAVPVPDLELDVLVLSCHYPRKQRGDSGLKQLAPGFNPAFWHKACALYFPTSFWNRCYYLHLLIKEANSQEF